MMFTVGNVSASEDHNLTDVQLHAVLGIITNFILSDVDSDGDGVYDSQDAFPHDPTESVDTDGDGIGNNADTDDDGDGASDVEEIAAGSDPLDPDDLALGGLAYKVVTSPYTGHKWLDRNLGASQACTSFDDASCYGDYYQWGRDADGHEKSGSGTTSTQATSTYTTDDKFIIEHVDWVTGYHHNYPNQRATRWSQRDGSSVCPVGFRVPTQAELQTETLDNGVVNSDTAFYNFLKLPSAGFRSWNTAHMVYVGSKGYVWTSSVSGSKSSRFSFEGSSVNFNTIPRSNGDSVRCMKPVVTTDAPPVVTLHSSANIQMIQFGSYPIISATAVDDVDGILGLQVVATDSQGQTWGLLPTNVAGTYTISYSAIDSAGQASNVVTVTVTVYLAMKKTGQTVSYDASGNEVTDGSLKDDGHYQKGHDPLYVRDDGDHIVSDNITGLEWQDDLAAKTVTKQWLTTTNYDDCSDNGNNCENTSGDTATTYCAALSLGGHEDWRLPTRKELVGLADYGQTNPAMSPVFENVASNYYWSSTTYAGASSNAWYVRFNSGFQYDYYKSDSLYVRCVRAGQ